MEEEISFNHGGVTHAGSYNVEGDELIVYLPDCSQRTTTLRGLDPITTALTHLRAFVRHSKKGVSV